MLHARPDYNRIQDPAVEDSSLLSPGSTPIGENEPVFILRAQDITAAAIVREWAALNEKLGGSATAINLAKTQARRMESWHTRKLADMG